jgi:hypothetical protein
LYGSAGTDELFGDSGGDYLSPGNNDDYDFVDAGGGNDHIDAFNMTNGFLEVSHYDLRDLVSQVITSDTAATQSAIFGTVATVDKGVYGTTTIGF